MKIVLTTVDAGADELARSLVESRVAACVQVVPVRSYYRWQGELTESAEQLLVIKTLDAERVAGALAASHPYEVPEIVTLAVDAVNEPYLAWMHESCAGSAHGEGGEQ